MTKPHLSLSFSELGTHSHKRGASLGRCLSWARLGGVARAERPELRGLEGCVGVCRMTWVVEAGEVHVFQISGGTAGASVTQNQDAQCHMLGPEGEG